MLAADYILNAKNYNALGCYARGLPKHVENVKIKKTDLLKRMSRKQDQENEMQDMTAGLIPKKSIKSKFIIKRDDCNITTLSADFSHQVHCRLSKIASRNSNGLFVNPEMIATQLKNVDQNIIVSKELKKSPTFQVLAKLYKAHIIFQNPGIEDEQQATDMLYLILELLQEQKRLNSAIPIIKVSLVMIDHPLIETNVKPHIRQLMDYLPCYTISFNEGIVDYMDPIFRKLFLKWLIPDCKGQITFKKYYLAREYVIANLSAYSDEFVKANISIPYFKSFNMLEIRDIKLEFSGNSDVVIGLREDFTSNNDYQNMKAIDMYDKLFWNGMTLFTIGLGLSDQMKVKKVSKIPRIFIRQDASAFILKFFERLNDMSYHHVNMVIIANKGTGKSKFTKALDEFLNDFGVGSRVISSDAYGIWRSSLAHYDTPVPVKYDDIKNYGDMDKQKSIYFKQALDVLNAEKITTIKQYLRLSANRREKMQKTLSSIIGEYMYTKGDPNNEFYFYDQLSNEENRPRVIIFEMHTSTQDMIGPRTDLTSNLLNCFDARQSVISRDDNVTDLLLFDTYASLQAYNHVAIYPYEWKCVWTMMKRES